MHEPGAEGIILLDAAAGEIVRRQIGADKFHGAALALAESDCIEVVVA
jgi:hypothetical protein